MARKKKSPNITPLNSSAQFRPREPFCFPRHVSEHHRLLSAGSCPCCKHRPDADLGDLDLGHDLGGDLGDLGPADHDLGEDPGQGSPGSPESAQSAHAHPDQEEY